MAKNLLLTSLILSALLCSCSKRLMVVLYNNSVVDLRVLDRGKGTLADIAPGKTAEFYFQADQWIDFGMIGHRYENVGFNGTGFIHEGTVKVQAEKDGRLWLVPFDATFPVTTFPEQPAGFPLAPAESVDLTMKAWPSNNAFQATSSLRSAAPERGRCAS